LLRSATLAARDAAYADSEALRQLLSVTTRSGDAVTIERAWLRATDPAIGTRVLRMALRPLMSQDVWRELTFERVEALRLAADGRNGARIELPGGVVAVVERTRVALHVSQNNAKDDNAADAGES
jgi:hypothetical protein